MIHRLEVKNFYSIRDDSSVSFLVGERAPKTSAYFTDVENTRLTKVLGVFGHNASGKTSILKVLPFISWFIVSSFKDLETDEKITVRPFLFGKNQFEPTTFAVIFELEGSIYNYELVLSDTRVISEKLLKKSKRAKRSVFSMVFTRQYDVDRKKYRIVSTRIRLPKEIGVLVRQNCSLLSVLGHLESNILKDVRDYWTFHISNVSEKGLNMERQSMRYRSTGETLAENRILKKQVESLIQKYDIGLKGIEIQKEPIRNREGKQSYTYSLFGIHETRMHSENNIPQKLEFEYESAGTRTLLMTLTFLLTALSVKAPLVIFDELDLGIHPHMTSELIDLFISPETNPHNTQLFFSVHSPEIMSKLDKYQIMLVEKDNDGATSVYRLDEIKGVRSNDNFVAKYNAGAYGGIPDIQ